MSHNRPEGVLIVPSVLEGSLYFVSAVHLSARRAYLVGEYGETLASAPHKQKDNLAKMSFSQLVKFIESAT